MFTSPDAVGKIIKLSIGDSFDPFIEAAGQLVGDVCLNSGYTDDKLELIERWLSAHFYAIYKRRRSSEKAGDVAQTFDPFQHGLFFNNTLYGQMAAALDTAGNLAILQRNLEKGGTATVKWIGSHSHRR